MSMLRAVMDKRGHVKKIIKMSNVRQRWQFKKRTEKETLEVKNALRRLWWAH